MEKNAMDQAMEKNVRPWLDLVDQLRTFGIEQDLPIPQIAVMGDQSSGKSSVLEAISGIPFPRGSGLVTRCATQLTLKRTKGPWSAKVSVRWEKDPSQKQPEACNRPVTKPEDVASVIEDLTEALLDSSGSHFSEDTIVIDIAAENVPDLTLIDLPGIVRTTTTGQDKKVIAQVESLITRYLQQERTIILAVIPVNVDIATVDILERARVVDVSGDRTVGVLTKPDLIDEGGEDEVVDVLRNITKPLKLGYNMVKNRSNAQLREGVALKDATDEETRYFREHSHFGQMEPDYFGVQNLTTTLTRILVKRIQTALPQMSTEVEKQLKTTRQSLNDLGEAPPEGRHEQEKRLYAKVTQFTTLIADLNDAKYDDFQVCSNPELFMCTKGRELFEEFAGTVRALRPLFEAPVQPGDTGDALPLRTHAEIKIAIKRQRGRELPGILNVQVLNSLLAQFVKEWLEPAERCLLQLKALLLNITHVLCDRQLSTYPALQSHFKQTVRGHINAVEKEARSQIGKVFQREKSPYTANASFVHTVNQIRLERFMVQYEQNSGIWKAAAGIDGKAAMADWYKRTHFIGSESNADEEAHEMCMYLKAYWDIAMNRAVDEICMVLESASAYI
jgi:interferon-induced GTP-binding protein Mx1